MFNHFSLAVDGLTPNFKHYTFAVLGRRVSISIVPKKKKHGGGGSYNKPLESDTYEIIVKVEFKKRVWTEKRTVNKRTAHIVAKLVAGFRRVSSIGTNIGMTARFISNRVKEVLINIKKINKEH